MIPASPDTTAGKSPQSASRPRATGRDAAGASAPAMAGAIRRAIRPGPRWPRCLHLLLLPFLLMPFLLLPFLLTPLCAAAATTAVTIRSGNHPGFGRVVFDASPHVRYRVVRDGDRVTVLFSDDVTLKGNPGLPHNVAALNADRTQVTLTLAPGSTFRDARLGDHVVIDVFDPPAAAGKANAPERPASPGQRSAKSSHRSGAAPSPALTADAAPAADPALARRGPGAAGPARTEPARSGTVNEPPVKGPVTGSAPPAAAPPLDPDSGSTAAEPPSASGMAAPPASGPVALAAVPLTLPPDAKGAAFSLPFPEAAGAAVFRRRGETLLVFDARRPVDLGPVQSNPAFAGAAAELVPGGTVVRMTPPAGTAVTLEQTARSWTVAALAAPPAPKALATSAGDAELDIAAQAPGRVVTVPDPATGGTLLVGTQRQSGQAMLAPRHTPQFTLLQTARGVVVAPLADTVALRVVPSGFAVTTGAAPLAVSRNGVNLLGDAAALTRRFDFPSLPPEQLTRLLAREVAGAAAEPVLARGPKRRAAALAMISLGMGAEAQSLLAVATADDPRLAASADVAGLTAIAAMLADRPAEAAGIDDPRLSGTDEVMLWRALRIAMLDEASPFAATGLAGTVSLLLTYTAAIRDRMLPLAVETMVQGGAVGRCGDC